MNRLLALLLALLPVPALAQHGGPPSRPPRAYSVAPVPPQDVEGWRADVQQLLRELERVHPAPYKRTPREVIEAAARTLQARVPALAAHEIIVEMQRIVALVGDGHTNINLAAATGVDFHQLPVRFGFYEDGVYIEAADRAYADVVGGRIASIGAVPIDSAIARLRPLISRDNDFWIDAAAPHLLNLVEVLHALRLTDTLERARITVARDGRTRDVDITPLPHTRPRDFGYPFRPQYTGDWIDARDSVADKLPITLRPFDRVHDWAYVPEQRLLYIRWDQVQNRSPHEPALRTFRDAMAFARDSAQRIDRVLLDLRNNTGGEGGLLDPIVREIVRTREADEPGRFFVAIGPRTFSAALLMSVALQRYARPLFVGEPTGGKVNVHAGHEFATLEHSGIQIAISPSLYQTSFPNDTRVAVFPQLYVRPSFQDYLAGRDPVLDAVLAYRPSDVAARVETAVLQGDTIDAQRVLRAAAHNPLNRYNPVAAEANALGYRLLQAGQVDAALRVFRLNVRVHPDYANGWDSLGEAYEQAGRIEEAVEAFEQVLRLEPGNSRAREFLLRLKPR